MESGEETTERGRVGLASAEIVGSYGCYTHRTHAQPLNGLWSGITHSKKTAIY